MSKEKNDEIKNVSDENKIMDANVSDFSLLTPFLSINDNIANVNSGEGKIDEPATSSLVDIFYQNINSVLGGSNPDQFLCLTIPGQALSAEDFKYDYKNNAPKGPVIEANESRLANKLFDPCRMTGADNGLTLPYQYRTALDMLTPKLNLKIAEAKNQLRQLLMTEYPYDFGDGSDKKYTLQEVFFRLYDEWIEQSEKWAEMQANKKEELRKKYPESDVESNRLFNDKYLEWYETVAESCLNGINEKMSKVISVFTPNDMKILEGILDSGSGAELQQARQTLTNTQKLTPDGGYVYPVKLNPTNWFEMLDTSFTAIDLLKTPDVLSTQLSLLSSRRLSLNAQISDISAMIPDKQSIKAAQNALDAAKNVLDTAQSSLINTYGDGIKTVLNTILDIVPLFAEGKVPVNIINKLTTGVNVKEGKTVADLVNSLKESLSTTATAQQNYINASQKLAEASKNAIEAQNLENLKNIISPLKTQLEQIDMEIKGIQMQIQLATVVHPKSDKDGKVVDNNTSESAVAPTSIPKGYTQIVITANSSSLDKTTSSEKSSNVSTYGGNFFFCGRHSESSSASSQYKDFVSQKDTSIQIGMNVAKVGIEREWFNPGIFALTKDMFNVTSLKIAPPNNYDSVSDERLKAMRNSIFPCYPTAMVIARDITVKLISKSSMSSEFADSMEKHASSGGGFLFFSGSSSSSSSSSSTGVHAASTDNSVTIKFDTPQIIGYYLEATHADKSSYLDDTSIDAQAGYVSISKFVEDYKKILEAMNKKQNQKEE